MNRAGVSTPAWVILKSLVGLKTRPNGDDPVTWRPTFWIGTVGLVAPA